MQTISQHYAGSKQFFLDSNTDKDSPGRSSKTTAICTVVVRDHIPELKVLHLSFSFRSCVHGEGSRSNGHGHGI